MTGEVVRADVRFGFHDPPAELRPAWKFADEDFSNQIARQRLGVAGEKGAAELPGRRSFARRRHRDEPSPTGTVSGRRWNPSRTSSSGARRGSHAAFAVGMN